MRWEVQGTGGLIPCGDVLADGALDALPFSVAAVDENFIVVASTSGVVGIDPVEDRVLFSVPKTNLHPNDAFVVDDPVAGTRLPIIAWSSSGTSSQLRGTIRLLEGYGIDGSVRHSWSGSDLVLGNATAMSANPNVATEALAMNSAVYTAAEVDLFDAARRRDPALIGPLSNASVYTISGGRSLGGTKRLAWSITIRDEMTGAQQPGMAISNDPWGTAELAFETIGSCGEESCEPIHTVLDPTLDQAVFTICEGSPRELLRFDIGGGVCELWADGSILGNRRLQYLTILP